MAQSQKPFILFLAAVLFACMAASPTYSQAPPVTPTPSALKSVPVRSVIRLLFTSVGKKYVLDDDVQGMTDAVGTPSDGPFAYILDTATDYTTPPICYEIKDDVYYFHRKHIPAPEDVKPHITLHYTGPVGEALKTLFQQAGLDNDDIHINPDVQGNVTIDLKDAPFAAALNILLTTTNPPLSCELKGRYLISVSAPNLLLPPKRSQ